MSTNLTVTPPPAAPATTVAPEAAKTEALGVDRAFVFQMARMPFFAVLWVLAAIGAHHAWAALVPTGPNYGPLVVVAFGMVLAAFIDGWALKVPNWVTLPLVLSGWALGIFHDCGVATDAGTGGFLTAFLCTLLGFALLLPMLVIRGVGEGDVKMQMGFGAWVGAYFGNPSAGMSGPGVVFWAFIFGAVIGGVFGMIMILVRRKFKQNANTLAEILMDLQMFASGNGSAAKKRAEDRRQRWVKLPYGIPLCVGFLLYLWYMLGLVG